MPSGIYKRTRRHKKILKSIHKGDRNHFYKDGYNLLRFNEKTINKFDKYFKKEKKDEQNITKSSLSI